MKEGREGKERAQGEGREGERVDISWRRPIA